MELKDYKDLFYSDQFNIYEVSLDKFSTKTLLKQDTLIHKWDISPDRKYLILGNNLSMDLYKDYKIKGSYILDFIDAIFISEVELFLVIFENSTYKYYIWNVEKEFIPDYILLIKDQEEMRFQIITEILFRFRNIIAIRKESQIEHIIIIIDLNTNKIIKYNDFPSPRHINRNIFSTSDTSSVPYHMGINKYYRINKDSSITEIILSHSIHGQVLFFDEKDKTIFTEDIYFQGKMFIEVWKEGKEGKLIPRFENRLCISVLTIYDESRNILIRNDNISEDIEIRSIDEKDRFTKKIESKTLGVKVKLYGDSTRYKKKYDKCSKHMTGYLNRNILGIIFKLI